MTRPIATVTAGAIIYALTLTDRGTSADYLASRIARDRLDILQRMKSGEYKSVRQAAEEGRCDVG